MQGKWIKIASFGYFSDALALKIEKCSHGPFPNHTLGHTPPY